MAETEETQMRLDPNQLEKPQNLESNKEKVKSFANRH